VPKLWLFPPSTPSSCTLSYPKRTTLMPKKRNRTTSRTFRRSRHAKRTKAVGNSSENVAVSDDVSATQNGSNGHPPIPSDSLHSFDSSDSGSSDTSDSSYSQNSSPNSSCSNCTVTTSHAPDDGDQTPSGVSTHQTYPDPMNWRTFCPSIGE
jgi:hypothetical protein